MITALSNMARRYATGRNILIFFVLQMTISAVVLPYMESKFDPQKAFGVLDLKFGFTPDEAYNTLTGYGEEGRKYYYWVEVCIDIIYPVIYTITNILLLSFVFQKGFSAGSFIQKFNIFPVFAAFGDFQENAFIITLINFYPTRADAIANFASIAGMFKWIAFGISIVLFLSGLIAWGIKAAQSRKI